MVVYPPQPLEEVISAGFDEETEEPFDIEVREKLNQHHSLVIKQYLPVVIIIKHVLHCSDLSISRF